MIIRVTKGADYTAGDSVDITPDRMDAYYELMISDPDYLVSSRGSSHLRIDADHDDGLMVDISDSSHAWVLYGGSKGDVYIGSPFADNISGRGGDDFLEGGLGGDLIGGGVGADTLTYGHSSAGVTLKLATGISRYALGSGGDAEGDHVNRVENLIGSDYADHLTGNRRGNMLTGGQGDDYLIGGGGADLMTGGKGADMFVFSTAKEFGGATTDEITDFSGGGGQGDKLDLTRIADFTVVDHAFDADGTAEVRGVKRGDHLIVSSDIDGDGQADFSLRLDTRTPLTQDDLAAPALAAPLHLDAFAHPEFGGGLHPAGHMAIV